MKMYKKILLTLDQSTADYLIIEHVCNLARIHKSRVTLLHVVHSHTLDQNRFLSKEAKSYLDEKLEYFQSRDIETEAILRSGEPEEEIILELERVEYDLVAMGTHGHNKLLDILYGSVSDHLKHHISTPLLLIKAES